MKDHVQQPFRFDSMRDALDAFGRGEFLVVMDDESRENEGDLIIAASMVTTEKMAWMIKHTRFVVPRSFVPVLLIAYPVDISVSAYPEIGSKSSNYPSWSPRTRTSSKPHIH